MGTLDSLLILQDIDTTLDQLRHRHDHLVERAELVAARQTVASSEAAVESAFAQLHEVRTAQKAAEDEASTVSDKATEVERMLYGGTITVAKELEAYQADLAMLKKRQESFEEEALEHMEEAEPLDAALGDRRTEAEAAVVGLADAEARLVIAVAEVEAELASVEAGRDEAVGALPSGVVEQYTVLRKGLGGIGAAALTGSRCAGCHLEIPSAELEQVRRAPDDAIVTCPECGRILVR